MQRKALAMLVLVALLVIGVGLLLWQQNAEAPGADEEVHTVPLGGSPQGDRWFGIATTTQGLTFYYPEPFPGRFVTSPEWPPVVALVAHTYSCTEGERTTINGREYCVTSSIEGAAGSTYTTYAYETDQGNDFILRIAFTIRTVQCANYDEPERAACAAEQAAWSSDELADRIAKSVRML